MRRAGVLSTHVHAAQGAAAPAAGPRPRVHLGTMTFGWKNASSPCDDAVAADMLRKYVAAGGVDLDTARIYAGGETEPICGRVLNTTGLRKQLAVATKVHPSQAGGLGAGGIRAQLQTSLAALGAERVDVLYLHQPDPEHDLTESLATVDALVKEGTVGAVGLSNYSAAETERCVELCVAKGWAKPVVYQGLYNAVNRRVEADLLPVLRKHGIAFIAYNPLAAGLLTGKHSQGAEVKEGRFKDNPNYLPRFYTDANFEALAAIRAACEQAGVGMVQAAYSWLLHHSQIGRAEGDGVLLGASSVAQLEQNLACCAAAAPLPDAVVAAYEKAWGYTQPSAFAFWRSYSKDMPGREGLDQGAAYSAGGPKK